MTNRISYYCIFILCYILNILRAHSTLQEQIKNNIMQAHKRQLQPSITLSCNAGSSFATQNQLVVHTAQAIALTCMDFRLVDDSACLLNMQGYNNNYDSFVLAGASLGFNAFPDWAADFNKHVYLSEFLHEIHKIIVVDHANCGAYKLVFPNISWSTISAVDEYQLHVTQIQNFAAAMKYYYPNLTVEAYYLYVNGSATPVPIQQGIGTYTPSSSSNQLNSGDIAAIVLGIVLFLFMVGTAIWCIMLRRKSVRISSKTLSPAEQSEDKVPIKSHTTP